MMGSIQTLMTDHIDVWTGADTEKKSGRGRASGNAANVYGIKKLRELILELAVRGKLVPQDASDEPASELLKRIEVEKAKLISEGKIKKSKPLAEITDDEKSFELPNCWELVRLPEVYYSIPVSGSQLLSSEIQESGSFPVVDQGQRFIAGYTNKEELLIKLPGPVIVFGDHTRERKLIDFDFVAGADGVKILRPVIIYERFFWIQLLSLKLEGRGYARHFNILNGSLFSVPPIPEQHRIVAKVDELMALCDQLENQHTDAITAHEKLVSYLLDTLIQSQDAADFNENWQRIAANFEMLFTTESSIDALKQTLLQLAVMGKLVPQDASDEPASELLKRIQDEKTKLVADGKIKKSKPLAAIEEDGIPFGLPKGWVWARLSDVLDVRDGTHDSPKDAQGEDVFPLITSKNFCNGEIDFTGARKISAADHYEISKRSLVERFDILFSMIGGNIGNQVLVNDDREFSIKNVALFKYYDRSYTTPFFIKRFLEHLALNLQTQAAGGAQPFVSLGFLRSLLIALPPVNEQHRVVTKVDELMSLCDTLKSRITAANQLQQKIADVMVEQAVA